MSCKRVTDLLHLQVYLLQTRQTSPPLAHSQCFLCYLQEKFDAEASIDPQELGSKVTCD